MPNKSRKDITGEQWREAIDANELGTKHGVQIARELGISSATLSREFNRRGCEKACRVGEIVAALEAEYGRIDRLKARRRKAQDAAAADAGAAIEHLISAMLRELIAADKAGNLAAAGPAIETIRKSLGAKPLH